VQGEEGIGMERWWEGGRGCYRERVRGKEENGDWNG
jgi:hypothetical protein